MWFGFLWEFDFWYDFKIASLKRHTSIEKVILVTLCIFLEFTWQAPVLCDMFFFFFCKCPFLTFRICIHIVRIIIKNSLMAMIIRYSSSHFFILQIISRYAFEVRKLRFQINGRIFETKTNFFIEKFFFFYFMLQLLSTNLIWKCAFYFVLSSL